MFFSSSAACSSSRSVQFAPPPLPNRRDDTVSIAVRNVPTGSTSTDHLGVSQAISYVSETTGRRAVAKRGIVKLNQLNLDGMVATIKDESNPSKILIQGTIRDGRIELHKEYANLDANHCVLAEQFARNVGVLGDYWARITVKYFDGNERTLKDLRDSFDKEITNAKIRVRNDLRDAGIQTASQLEMFKQLQCENLIAFSKVPRHLQALQSVTYHTTAYRVLRKDESLVNGIMVPVMEGTGTTNNKISGKSKRPVQINEGESFAFFDAMSGHIANASRQKSADQRAFISSSGSVYSALSWGGFGIQKIAVIDLVECARHNVAAWQMGSVHQKLITTGARTASQATSSDEIIFSENIPKSAVKDLRVTWETVQKPITSDVANRKARGKKSQKQSGFPEKLDLDNIKVLEIFESASTRPYLVEIDDQKYILKLGGRKSSKRSAHVETEFFANVCYTLAGIAVAPVALYVVNVRSSAQGLLDIPCVYVLLSKYLERKRNVSGRDYDQLYGGLAMDVALANFDVCGPDFNNLIVSDSLTHDEERVYRIDQGGCFEYNPLGTFKIGYDGTADSVAKDVENFIRKQSDESSHLKRIEVFYGNPANGSDDDLKQAFRERLRSSAKEIMNRFERAMVTWLKEQDSLFPDWNDKYLCLMSRLRLLQGVSQIPKSINIREMNSVFTQNMNSGNASSAEMRQDLEPGSATATVPRLRGQIRVASRKHFKGGKEGEDVVDVTSKSKDFSELSPFYNHGHFKVPFMGDRESCSVEGIWQGLKIFQHEGVDESKFGLTGTEGFKRRAGRARGNILGHYGGPERVISPVGNARREIYLPLYEQQLNCCTAQITTLRQMLEKKNLVLLDFNTSMDLDSSKPLSHAQLIKEFILKDTLEAFGRPR